MSKEGQDQHHDHEFDFEDIERELNADEENTYVDPVIANFKVGLPYEIFCDCIRNSASHSAARSYFDSEKACVLLIRCADIGDKNLYMAALDHILEGSYRQKFRSGKPENSCVLDGEVYLTKHTEKDVLEKVFEYRRIFIFTLADTKISNSLAGFVDAEVHLSMTSDALESAIKKFVDKDFSFSPDRHAYLMEIPVSQHISGFSENRKMNDSLRLLKRWLSSSTDNPEAAKVEGNPSGPTLDDLHGLGAAGEWGRDLALDLSDWKAGKISWSEVDKGILISGAPGTGKTTFAGALARTCGVKFVATSMAQWQAKGHLGDYLKGMRRSFDEAQKCAPCILFIDEFDSAGDRNSQSTDHDDYVRRAVNGLLECLDGVSGREGIVVVGATNHPEKIDAALCRPGRMDKLVEIPMPDAKAREGILRFHLKGDLLDADLSPVAARTEGMSGAWLEAVVRDGRRFARRQRREMEVDDLMQALPKRSKMPAAALEMNAIHEAGHAVVALELGRTVLSAKVTLEVVEVADQLFEGGSVSVERGNDNKYSRSTTYSREMILQLLGGLAAEDELFGQRNDGGWADLKEATWWSARQWISTGQKDALTYLSDPDAKSVLQVLKLRSDVQKKVEEELQSCMKEVKLIIKRRHSDVRKIADALIERGEISGEDISNLLAPKPKIRLLSRMQERPDDVYEESFYECA